LFPILERGERAGIKQTSKTEQRRLTRQRSPFDRTNQLSFAKERQTVAHRPRDLDSRSPSVRPLVVEAANSLPAEVAHVKTI
jgi:hypothetical protein